MTIEKLKELARHSAHRTAPAEYSVESVDKAFADGMKEIAGSINAFMKNRYDIYDIIIENADEIVPQKVMEQFGSFAEVRNVAQGDKVLFKRGPLGRARAKKFLTQVGLSGVYESFRLDSETFTVGMKAIGGAVSIDKMYRTPYVSWWPEEEITYHDIDNALDHLEKINNKVDYVITHEPSLTDMAHVSRHCRVDPLSTFFDELSHNITYKKWYFGSLHENKKLRHTKSHSLFTDIVRII